MNECETDRLPENEINNPHVAAPSQPSFPVVGIGASAGGLEALELFLSAVPTNSGMAT
ncbi:hypothetical protein [Nitrincola sp. A-D6]|uniref:hypothetical protein n=1 Tax=Nitrincola sp. A-D6 TaxID=1545442 RepID=UPI000AAEA02D|nr:hypothetical protein [Nitrincola sp. A-D6]